MFTNFRAEGMQPKEKNRLNSADRGRARKAEQDLRTKVLITSEPVAEAGSTELSLPCQARKLQSTVDSGYVPCTRPLPTLCTRRRQSGMGWVHEI